MRPIRLFYATAIVTLGAHVLAVPIDSSGNEVSVEESNGVAEPSEAIEESKPPATPGPKPVDEEATNSNPEATYVLPENHGSSTGAHFDPSIYAGYVTPEAFQQYLSQFAGAFAPYAYPGYGAAPTPVYPGPFAVQTGYDGFLVPAITTSVSPSNTAVSTSIIGNIATVIHTISTFLMRSPFIQIILTALGALAMIVFGGALTTAICNFTPLCNISLKAVTYLRGDGAADMGRMIAEEMTPERVRRAAEFVRNAIRKYKELQTRMQAEDQRS
ncbi:uncharacterized protein LOC142219479 [Haematobia irritans]|uniref:uncharacterized protein LOC142219479 n=1 Tax=Haematobia irritans TaxID=7368 RepID=UPI003F4FDDD0